MLIDTSALLRTLQVRHPEYELIARALELLPQQGRELHIVPQNLVELWVVATRPLEQNGLGLTPAAAAAELNRIKGMFPLLPETAAIYPAWEALVTKHAVSGKPSHDARLVAAMQVHGLTAILTFDKSGFKRFPGIEVVHPAEVQPVEAAASDVEPSQEQPGPEASVEKAEAEPPPSDPSSD